MAKKKVTKKKTAKNKVAINGKTSKKAKNIAASAITKRLDRKTAPKGTNSTGPRKK